MMLDFTRSERSHLGIEWEMGAAPLEGAWWVADRGREQGFGAPAVMLAALIVGWCAGIWGRARAMSRFPAFPAWCRVRGSGLVRELIGGLDRL